MFFWVITIIIFFRRVEALEHCFQRQSSPLESVQSLKAEVHELRTKLENYEHLSWLGFYKALHPPPLMDPAIEATTHGQKSTLGPGYHKRNREGKQQICDKFLRLSDVVLTRETCQLLREPTFDNWQWEDEEMLVLLQQMYLDLELPKKFDIEINILRNFLVRVYHNYNDVPFHNFRHCFCVTQMVCLNFLNFKTYLNSDILDKIMWFFYCLMINLKLHCPSQNHVYTSTRLWQRTSSIEEGHSSRPCYVVFSQLCTLLVSFPTICATAVFI